jgi:hypothetical protein
MPEKTGQLAGPAIMFLSALVFGYFGFFHTWSTRGAGGEFVLFPALLGWTLKISSVLFLVSAGLAIVKLVAGNLIYALTGVTGAGMFVVIAVMDIADQGHTIMPYAPVVLRMPRSCSSCSRPGTATVPGWRCGPSSRGAPSRPPETVAPSHEPAQDCVHNAGARGHRHGGLAAVAQRAGCCGTRSGGGSCTKASPASSGGAAGSCRRSPTIISARR